MWRALTTAAAPRKHLRELKRHVLRLYKHIHPDRLGRYPHHRAVNESSFQVLQSALDKHFDRMEARTSDLPPRGAQRSRELTFFATHEDGLKKAVVKFHESRLGHTLQSLFEELDLDPPPADVLPGGSVKTTQFSSLTDLAKHARHVAMASIKRQETAAKESQALNDEVVVTRMALQRSRGVHITLGDGLPKQDRLKLIFRRLARTLKELDDVDVESLIIELDGGFDVALNTDGIFPCVHLGACASDHSWQGLLRSEGVRVACEGSRSYAEGVRFLEALTAKHVGVRLVMHDIGFGHSTDQGKIPQNVSKSLMEGSAILKHYVRMLESMRDSGDFKKTMKTAGMSSLALMFSEKSGSHVDVEQGVLRIGLDEHLDSVVHTLQREGPRIGMEYERRMKAMENEKRDVSNVKRALGIESLRRHEDVSDREWSEALLHMRMEAGRLRGALDGVPVVVGTQARFVGESGEIEIPFNFHNVMKV